MAYSRRGLGLGVAVLGLCLLGFGLVAGILDALTPTPPCTNSICLFEQGDFVVAFALVAVAGLLILVTGLFLLVSARKKPLVFGPKSHGS